MNFVHFIRIGLIASFSLVICSCANTRPVAYNELSSSVHLKPHKGSRGNRMPYAYRSEVNWSRYTEAIIEPVRIYQGRDAQFEKVSDPDKRMLVAYMQEKFGEEIEKRWRRATEPKENTLRVRITLTGAKPSKPVVNTFMKMDIGGAPYNAVQAARGAEGAFTGSVSYAVEIFDARTSRLLSAYVEKQYPNAMNVKASLGAYGAAKTGIRKGAEQLVENMK